MFLEWGFKLCASFSVHNKIVFNVLQGQGRPSEFDADQETTRATWDAANQDLYSVLFFTTADLAFSVVWGFQGKISAERAGHGQQAWAALREKFDGCSRAAIRVEHIRTTSTRMRPGQAPDDYLFHMDSYRGRLKRVRSTGRLHGSAIRGHHPRSPSLGVRPYSSNPSREERLRPCRHPPYDGGYLRGQLVPFRIIKRHRGTRCRNAGGGPGPH